jgi:hypothetical protein
MRRTRTLAASTAAAAILLTFAGGATQASAAAADAVDNEISVQLEQTEDTMVPAAAAPCDGPANIRASQSYDVKNGADILTVKNCTTVSVRVQTGMYLGPVHSWNTCKTLAPGQSATEWTSQPLWKLEWRKC